MMGRTFTQEGQWTPQINYVQFGAVKEEENKGTAENPCEKKNMQGWCDKGECEVCKLSESFE